MTILCATDFSERSRRAAVAAARLAARRGVPLWLVHAASAKALHVARAPVLQGLEALLGKEAEGLAGLGAEVRVAVLEGVPAEALMAFAAKQEATLLVVGTTGRTGAFSGIGGSLDRFAQAATLPLLRVANPAPFEAWARGEQPLHVMLAVDRSGATQVARAWLTELRRYGPIQLTAAHVYYPYDEHRRLGVPMPHASNEPSMELIVALSDMVATLAAPRDGSPSPAICLHRGMGPLGEELVAVAVKERAELLVMGTHPHGLEQLWSLTHHALRHAPMAVAVVPGTAVQDRPALPVLRRVLVATDFSERGDQAIPLAFALAPAGAAVHVVTVETPSGSPEAHRKQRQLLQQRVPPEAAARGVTAHVEVLSGSNVPDTLAKAAARLNADLVCLSAQGRGGIGQELLGSVAHQLLDQCRQPVLVVPPLAL